MTRRVCCGYGISVWARRFWKVGRALNRLGRCAHSVGDLLDPQLTLPKRCASCAKLVSEASAPAALRKDCVVRRRRHTDLSSYVSSSVACPKTLKKPLLFLFPQLIAAYGFSILGLRILWSNTFDVTTFRSMSIVAVFSSLLGKNTRFPRSKTFHTLFHKVPLCAETSDEREEKSALKLECVRRERTLPDGLAGSSAGRYAQKCEQFPFASSLRGHRDTKKAPSNHFGAPPPPYSSTPPLLALY